MMDDDFDFDDLASFDNDANSIVSKRKTKRTDSWIAVHEIGIISSYPNHASFKNDTKLNQFQWKFFTNSNKNVWQHDTNFKLDYISNLLSISLQ